jgi:hypothetical protein
MDVETMHIGVKQHLDKTSALELPSFEATEIDFWLNEAIRKFVKTRYSGVNFKRESFEETQKRIDDLRTLVTVQDLTLSDSGANWTNGYANTTAIPANYWLMVGEEATITVSGTSSRVGVTQCNQNEYRQKIDDPFSEHILHYQTAKPLRLFYETSVELISDGNYTVDTYHLTYIKQPTEVVYSTGTDCDLPVQTHDEIVKMAADMMLENIESPRYKTHSAEVATME